MKAFEEPGYDWAAFARQVQSALSDLGQSIAEAWGQGGAATPELRVYWRRCDRALARSRRNTAGQRRRRKHGARR